MTPTRFDQIAAQYRQLRLAVLGDFCLDRYLEIDPGKRETSIETCLPVHNVVNVRSQPGAAGTILNNLVALGVGDISPVAFCGEDGEGYELLRALKARPGVGLEHFIVTPERRTFTYCKPLVMEFGQPPRELSRLDSKNWAPTPPSIQQEIINSLRRVFDHASAVIVMDQVDVAETGVVTRDVLSELSHLSLGRPDIWVLADSRRGLKGYADIGLKMNESELRNLAGDPIESLDDVRFFAARLANAQRHPVFVTLAERGIVGAAPKSVAEHVPAYPVQGEIDIVGAGDAVTANLTVALAAGATMCEALQIAMAAASVVIHQLGTTGTASVAQIRARMFGQPNEDD